MVKISEIRAITSIIKGRKITIREFIYIYATLLLIVILIATIVIKLKG